MKTRSLVTKAMALLMACAMVMGNTCMVAHASDDGCAREERESTSSGGGGASLDIGSGNSNSGSSSSSDSGSSYSEPSSSNSGSSYSSDDGCVREERESTSSNGGGASLDASYSAPAPKAAGVNASTGKETFRAVAKAANGTYEVYHKGVRIAGLNLIKVDGKTTVACDKVALVQKADGKWTVEFTVADATGLTIGAPVDRTYLYNTLGINTVTINGTVIIDIEAEAAAAKAAK